ncbi:hypothetical protein BN9982_140017 [Mycobacterium tuberculosis]|nr:hypothetical protein BN9982_140017 [Mycobacterium tuberculosis]
MVVAYFPLIHCVNLESVVIRCVLRTEEGRWTAWMTPTNASSPSWPSMHGPPSPRSVTR